MKIDLGVLSKTISTYEEVYGGLDENLTKLKEIISLLIACGWSGKAAEQYEARLEYFTEKQYKPLEESIKCLKAVLNDIVKAKGVALKSQCEDFANCFEGIEKWYYSDNGACEGVVSLEYDNVNRIVGIYDEIATQKSSGFFVSSTSSDMLSQKKRRIEELGDRVKRQGAFSGHLEYTNFDISNEVAECLNNIKKEEKALSTFIESLKSYSSGLKNLEENTCRRLNEVQSVEKMVVMNGEQKAWQVGMKTVTNDIIGGGLTAIEGAKITYASIMAEPETGGLSTAGIIIGGSMFFSGGNTFINGITDLKYEWNYNWAEVGQHNFLTDSTAYLVTKTTGSDTGGKITGNTVTTFVDIVASGKSGWDLRKLPKDIDNIKKITNIDNTLDSVKSIDTVLRCDALGNYYNGVTIKGDIDSLKNEVFGDDSLNNSVTDGVNVNSNKVTSTYPNIRTVYNNGNLQLIK